MPEITALRHSPSICFEIGRQICSHPRRFWKLLRRSLFRHWKSFETFGENLWAFCAGLRLGRQFVDDGIDMAYAPGREGQPQLHGLLRK